MVSLLTLTSFRLGRYRVTAGKVRSGIQVLCCINPTNDVGGNV